MAAKNSQSFGLTAHGASDSSPFLRLFLTWPIQFHGVFRSVYPEVFLLFFPLSGHVLPLRQAVLLPGRSVFHILPGHPEKPGTTFPGFWPHGHGRMPALSSAFLSDVHNRPSAVSSLLSSFGRPGRFQKLRLFFQGLLYDTDNK